MKLPQWIFSSYRNTGRHYSRLQHLFVYPNELICIYSVLRPRHFSTKLVISIKLSAIEVWERCNMLTCKMAPSANNAFGQFSYFFVTSNSLSNAPFVSFTFKYKIPISVKISMLSVVILNRKCNFFLKESVETSWKETYCNVFSSISIAFGKLFSVL